MKKKIDIGIIILHYNNIEDTNECIESIKSNIDTKLFQIIVIDNKSPDGSGNVLSSKYQDDINVKIILNEKNEGFSG